ncbi:helix-turn-helix domain-containing protein [Kitasatospora sp. RB6PN24]|uniref:helix-turn-helix domain-containing protein n=1 Tax=Kitasatospora humi TaxID=2893891 RepID=UPI001E64F036|nr:helix-turn-helix domain-containing protein [Kitasatospora humi]MCC9308648.1 helix-turn-helix domain-containing protein [Kitasatospora humi]
MTSDSELLTVPEVMARLKISRSTVYDLIRTRQLASITIGRARRIPTHALTALVHHHLAEAA